MIASVLSATHRECDLGLSESWVQGIHCISFVIPTCIGQTNWLLLAGDNLHGAVNGECVHICIHVCRCNYESVWVYCCLCV